MEYLIKEAFLHVADLGPHVAGGQYDLLGPKDEIIMPSIWESVIEPGWEITMHMWPIPEPPQGADALADGMAEVVIVEPGLPPPPPGGKVVDGVLLFPKAQTFIHANVHQRRKTRRRRRLRSRPL